MQNSALYAYKMTLSDGDVHKYAKKMYKNGECVSKFKADEVRGEVGKVVKDNTIDN